MSDDLNEQTPDGTKSSPPSPDGAGTNEIQETLKRLEAENEKFKREIRKVSSERDSLKQSKEREEAERNGETQKLLDSYKTEIETYRSKLADYDTLKETHDALVQQRRDELLAQLPKDAQDEWKDADVTTLSKVVKLAATQQPNIPGTHTGGSSAAKVGAKSWGDMTGAERAAFTLEHPNEVGAKIRAWRAGK
jgi:hypothetical protein